VLLNANVAFLAIPSVDESPEASPAQIASLLSIVSSVGSIILGLLLVRQHRTKAKEEASEAVGVQQIIAN
jgi:chaperone required for assembly of F1-ATPase